MNTFWRAEYTPWFNLLLKLKAAWFHDMRQSDVLVPQYNKSWFARGPRSYKQNADKIKAVFEFLRDQILWLANLSFWLSLESVAWD